jgi:hypothetical protein
MRAQFRGEWDNEPDLTLEKRGDYYLMVRRGPLGSLCGYVGLPSYHNLYGAEYTDNGWDNPVANLKVHGEVTWSGHFKKILSFIWWIGFDCAHLGDLTPDMRPIGDAVYRNLDYVTQEVEFLYEQLKGLE